ncbi:MAG: iron-containing alcohol dehydrogenase, partial [Actinomycetota bacterium]|nr:iron-containing alcohol dehydrogenase [Actinomycetota bacterium]
AELLGPNASTTAEPADQLPAVLIDLMRDIGIPAGIGAVGFGENDIDSLTAGAIKQQRLLTIAPRDVTPEALADILRSSIELW